MIHNEDKVSVFNFIMNTKGRVEFVGERFIGNSFTICFAEGKQSDSLEELGKSIRTAINSFNED